MGCSPVCVISIDIDATSLILTIEGTLQNASDIRNSLRSIGIWFNISQSSHIDIKDHILRGFCCVDRPVDIRH